MDAHGLDILVLGRQANIRYVTGAPQLWIAGTRPFGPMCVVVRATGDIYLNSTDDEGVPEEIGHDHLYGLAWNPMTLIDVLKKIDGAEAALRVGTDAITPTFAALLPEAFPNAEIVDAEPAMRAARRIKTPMKSQRWARRSVSPKTDSRLPSANWARGVGADAGRGDDGSMAAGGVSTPATQDAAWVTSREHPVATRPPTRRGAVGRPCRLRRRRVGRRLCRRGGQDLAGRRSVDDRHASSSSGRTRCTTDACCMPPRCVHPRSARRV